MNVEIQMTGWRPPASVDSKNQATEAIDLTFKDVAYTVGKGKNIKTIVHQVSGAFKAGQLSAILGPSGAGKTSLMNILAGLKSGKGILGRVEVNGVERQIRRFRKQSAYIMQKDHLLTLLTVWEYMIMSAHLKLGDQVSNREKKTTIESLLKTLGLTNSRHSFISCLSGGESKRFSIGLELIDNPAILFLDEPTSGLDSSASMQCLTLLQEIARKGRTVITTIHQPSKRLLDLFDHLYIVARGQCMYQGPVASLVPFFQSINLNCPSHHCPTDFALDVACGEYGNVLAELVTCIDNGRLIYQGESSIVPATLSSSHGDYDYQEKEFLLDSNQEKVAKQSKSKSRLVYAAPFSTQFSVLLKQSLKTIWRAQNLIMMRVFIHVSVAIILGTLYWQKGENASEVFNNAGLLFFLEFFILYTAMMPTVLTFPLERQVLVREYLNHWYSLKAFYLAKSMADIPFQVIVPTLFMTAIYLMTNQPMCLDRFFMLLTVTILMSLIGQSIGLVFGAAFDIQIAIFLAPITAIPFVLISGFCTKLDAYPEFIQWLTYGSFMRLGFDGVMVSIYGNDRPPLTCSLPYCHFRYPHKFLQLFDMEDISYFWSIFGMIVIFLVLRIAAYLVLLFKLRHLR